MEENNYCSLRGKKRFREVYDNGKSFANKYLIMFFLKNDYDYNRVGFVTTKKLGNSVLRNKCRRRLKEAFRKNSINIKLGYDIIFLFRTSAFETSYNQVESALLHILKISKLRK